RRRRVRSAQRRQLDAEQLLDLAKVPLRELAEAGIARVLDLSAQVTPRGVEIRPAARELGHVRHGGDRCEHSIGLHVEDPPGRLLRLADDVALNEERIDGVRIADEAEYE